MFYTIQGEGPYSGMPAVFFRFAGCNLQCPGCDTDYTTDRNTVPIENMVRYLEACNWPGLVVISGGEPFRQPADLVHLIRAIGVAYQMADNEAFIQIETNGTYPVDEYFWRELSQEVENMYSCYLCMVVCPKTSQLPRHFPRDAENVYYKYVVSADNGGVSPMDGLPLSVLGMRFHPARPLWVVNMTTTSMQFPNTIFLQPEDTKDPEQNRRNMELCVESCMKHGYRLCLQIHKIVGLP